MAGADRPALARRLAGAQLRLSDVRGENHRRAGRVAGPVELEQRDQRLGADRRRRAGALLRAVRPCGLPARVVPLRLRHGRDGRLRRRRVPGRPSAGGPGRRGGPGQEPDGARRARRGLPGDRELRSGARVRLPRRRAGDRPGAARRPGRRAVAARRERHPRLLAQGRGERAHLPRAHRGRRRSLPAHRRPRRPPGRRAVHHGPAQGDAHRQRAQPVPAGHRARRQGAARPVPGPDLQRLLGGGARGAGRRGPGAEPPGRHRGRPARTGRHDQERPRPGPGRTRAERDVRAAWRRTPDDQRQDPASRDARPVRRGRAQPGVRGARPRRTRPLPERGRRPERSGA